MRYFPSVKTPAGRGVLVARDGAGQYLIALPRAPRPKVVEDGKVISPGLSGVEHIFFPIDKVTLIDENGKEEKNVI